ncbi:MAG: sugar phosphate nucleotidyltransferase [candidate division Zixibacteria bacterium]|nr:sugar phosphate nucleotidyltransferase [candidate division Zixibacteria bacterium]
MIYGIILAGGKGERFWPLSREKRPKQFLKLTSEKMMLEETIDRILPLIPMERIRIVTGEQMKTQILENIPNITENHILSEPIGRNTAPAIGLAAAHLYRADPEAVMVVLSSDHLIRPAEKLLSILEIATRTAASDDVLITIGIVPTRPETAYGYIKMGDLHQKDNGYEIHKVSTFTEKPNAIAASEYYYSNDYLWNSGMFVWSAKTILQTMRECDPQLGERLDTYIEKVGTDSEDAARNEFYEQASNISIDFAVLEKASNVFTIKADIIWDDVGGWRSLERYKELDRENNVVTGQAIIEDTYETTVCNYSDGIIACLGVSDLVIVRVDDITLVTHRSKAHEIKKLLARLNENEDTKKYL